MKHLVISLFIISFCLLFSSNAQAAFQSDVTNCLKINDSNDRLDCYDTVVKYYKLNPSSNTVSSNTSSETKPPVSVSSSPISASVPAASPMMPVQNIPTQKDSTSARFGLVEAEEEGAVKSIQSSGRRIFRMGKRQNPKA